MTYSAVKAKWVSGNLQFTDTSGNVILEIDGPNRRIEPYNLLLVDSEGLVLGTGSDVTIQWNGTRLELAPTSGFWANCPYIAYPDPSLAFQYFQDFIGPVSLPAATGSGGGWKCHADSDPDVLAAAGSIGGHVQIAPETGSDKELYYQLGEKGTETFIEYVVSSGNQSWVEFRVAYTSVTNAANTIIGLAEEGCADSDFIADAGNDIADKDFIGFAVWEADPDAIAPIFQTSGSAFSDSDGTDIVPVAGTYLTLGLHFDGDTTLTYYANGTAKGALDISMTGFPNDEELSPFIGMKNGAGDAGLQLDWIRMIVER